MNLFNENGAIGCSYGHINCIKYLIDNIFLNGLIL